MNLLSLNTKENTEEKETQCRRNKSPPKQEKKNMKAVIL